MTKNFVCWSTSSYILHMTVFIWVVVSTSFFQMVEDIRHGPTLQFFYLFFFILYPPTNSFGNLKYNFACLCGDYTNPQNLKFSWYLSWLSHSNSFDSWYDDGFSNGLLFLHDNTNWGIFQAGGNSSFFKHWL